MTFGDNVINFLSSLEIRQDLPTGVGILDPYSDSSSMELVKKFYQKFYSDQAERTFLIGINPGRFGGGVTGIAFTDPINLESNCGIPNNLEKRRELSSAYMFRMMEAFGGPRHFFRRFYLTSVSPLGFVKEKRNLNYYDLPELQHGIESFMIDSLKRQIGFGARPIAYSLGQGKNISYLKSLNKRHSLFKEIRPLPHPRWIMQYRLKKIDEFIELYKRELEDK